MRSNETFTYREAMYAMLTRNANEAAMGLAYALSGGDLAGWVFIIYTVQEVQDSLGLSLIHIFPSC